MKYPLKSERLLLQQEQMNRLAIQNVVEVARDAELSTLI